MHNAVEIRPYGKYTLQDFYIEFNNHNFDEKGKRIVPCNQFLGNYKNNRKDNVDNEV